MPAVRALIVVLAACALALSAPLAPASAGGPTSVLLSVPGEGRTASLYYTDADYEQLTRLVGLTDGSGPVDGSGRDHDSGPVVTMTWLIHDVTPWRFDRIYLAAEGGPWIATQTMFDDDSGSLWDQPATWHRPTSGKELSMLLDRLGLTSGAAPVDQGQEPVEEPVAESAAASARTGTDGGGDDGADAATGVWWGLGGMAVGVLLVAGWVRVRATRDEDLAAGAVHPDASKDYLAPLPRS